jgi:hypothetical protein
MSLLGARFDDLMGGKPTERPASTQAFIWLFANAWEDAARMAWFGGMAVTPHIAAEG